MGTSNKEVRSDLVTNSSDPLAAQRAPEKSLSERDVAAKSAFASLLHEGGFGSYEQLNESGKQALRAFASLSPSDDRYESAKQAASDAIRDHRMAGLFTATETAVPILSSKDPSVRNQSPTGTQGETAGPQTSVAVTEPKKT